MTKHYLLYGHGGSYNHGGEALARTTIALLRREMPGCRITLSTHFAGQDIQFRLDADEIVERNPNGRTNEEVYAPTIARITPDTVCMHIGGDNYCYNNWQRYAFVHYKALERGAKSVMWSCSIDPDVITGEMLDALRTHHLITARERVTCDALTAHGLSNITRVADIAFTLMPESAEIELENFVALNFSPLILKRSRMLLPAFRNLVRYILNKTDMNIALVPHVVNPVDNDCDAFRQLDMLASPRIALVSGNLSAGQYKHIVSKASFCVAARTHLAIAAYSSCVPALAIGYSSKSRGIAGELGMEAHVLQVEDVQSEDAIANAFIKLVEHRNTISGVLENKMNRYIASAVPVGFFDL